MKNILAAISVLLIVIQTTVNTNAASVSEPIPIWPHGSPGDSGEIGVEHDITTSKDRPVGGKPVIRLGNVSAPTITVFRPSKHKANGTAVLICPGGGYAILAMDLEGTEVAQWLNSLGVTAVVLKYRVPARKGDDKHILPLEDAQRALGLIRSHAKDWDLDPKHIGILGFSAGGHLTGHLCSDFERRAYTSVDDADQISCRPDFALMIYPAYLVTKEHKNELEPQIKVTSNTPPTFLVQAEDDAVHVENSLTYYLALKNAKVPAEIHLYATGGHGYGLRPSSDAVSSWPKRAEEWLRGRGLLAKAHAAD